MELPIDIIYYIYSFNADHRPLYRKVMIELKQDFMLRRFIQIALEEIDIDFHLEFNNNIEED